LEASLSYRAALEDPRLASVTLGAVQAAIPANATLIELIEYRVFDPARTGAHDPWGDARLAALALRTTSEPQWFDLGPASVIDARVDELRPLLSTMLSSDDDC